VNLDWDGDCFRKGTNPASDFAEAGARVSRRYAIDRLAEFACVLGLGCQRMKL
jgi:hypothetical protein